MWENETIVLVTSLKKRILRGRKKVRFAEISGDQGLPTFIRVQFKDRVEKYIVEESPLTVQNTPHFDLKPDDLKHIRTRFLDVFRDAAAFPEEEIDEILHDALVLRLDYLVKPVDTMRRTLFNGAGDVERVVMEEKLSPFIEVLPYAEHVLKQVNLKDMSHLHREEYARITSDLLHTMQQQNPVERIRDDFSVLLRFLSETKSEEITRVEADLIQEFLLDRNMVGFRRAVDVEVKLGKKDFSSEDLEMTLKRYLELRHEFGHTSGDVKAAAAEPEKSPADMETKRDREAEAGIVPEQDEDIEGWVFEGIEDEPDKQPPSEEEKQPEQEVKAEEEIPVPDEAEEKEAEEKESREDDTVAAEKPKQKAMRIIRRDVTEDGDEEESGEKESRHEEPEPQRKGIREFFDKKTEKNFIKKLFSGDTDAFNELIEKLDEAESWRVAKILIDNELFKRDVDPFSREAIKLVDLVYGLYYPEESIGGGQ